VLLLRLRVGDGGGKRSLKPLSRQTIVAGRRQQTVAVCGGSEADHVYLRTCLPTVHVCKAGQVGARVRDIGGSHTNQDMSPRYGDSVEAKFDVPW
jgi:hypothetical protein